MVLHGTKMLAQARERSLDAMVADSSVRLEAWLDDQQSSPQERAEAATSNSYNLPMH